MAEHLWPLLRLKAETEEMLIEAYRQVYLESYVRHPDGSPVEMCDWNGVPVRFSGHPKVFEHAFSESSNYRKNTDHDVPFSKRRARCLLWIKEALTGNGCTLEIRSQTRTDSRGRSKKRRSLIVVEERYVVVLEENPRKGCLEFVTAFTADESYLKKLRSKSLHVDTKKPQS
jgi:hypothetical protein